MVHEGPPCLLSEERGADATSEGSAREVAICIGIVGICMEDGMCDALHHILISHFAQLAEMFVPC